MVSTITLPTSARPCDLINHLENVCLGAGDPETLCMEPES